jgi:hypothetical protein
MKGMHTLLHTSTATIANTIAVVTSGATATDAAQRSQYHLASLLTHVLGTVYVARTCSS